MDQSETCTRDITEMVAVQHLATSIRQAARFPNDVFSTGWSDPLFFDSDRIFDARFAGQVRTLLEVENAVCACMMNLDESADRTGKDQKRYCLFIDRTMTNMAYQSFLCGTTAADGWIYCFDRFGCASNMGEWCIYCERANEMAVIAFRTQGSLVKFESVITQLEAVPIKEAIEKPLSYAFDPRHLLREWQEQLRNEYRSK